MTPLLFAALLCSQAPNAAPDAITEKTLAGLQFRSIGPALTSGRVVGFAVRPGDRDNYFVAAASGGVWKTTNAGANWKPVFDKEGSYSIGTVVLDPANPQIVWVGTGENNSQRSVGYGDGVYRSDDSGQTWKNMGLKSSEHIGRIVIDPRDSRIVYVAAQGPLWGPGGDRGLFKTTDSGKTWKKVLTISDNTGVTDVVLDPRNPDVLIAAAYQRRRHVWTLINGGPESALYKSTDAGASWTKLKTGLPTEELGRIGLAVSPSQPNMVYAIIESVDKKGGIFRSTDFGATWERRNEFDQQAQYYAHLVVDPKNPERLYAMNVFLQVSDDGGKTLHNLGERFKHVDNHTIWIDPQNPNFYRVGCDGGIYESHDRGAHWNFISNLPITQFYDIAVDNNGPFYHVYGGTQDNFTLGGPAKTRSIHGITNNDWFVTQSGDGFTSRVDPVDPNTVYSEAQYGVLVRFDRRTGQAMGIQPQPGKGEPALRWNWDSPLIISPHSHTRLYFAANKLFKSDDRGNTWKAISGDLSRQIDRNQLPVMGKIWNADAVAKSVSTSLYGNIVALAESPKKEGLLYVGTDDGLIQVSETAGEPWRKVEKFPGVPDRAYVSRLLASLHDANTVYASFDNHKNADFAPYLIKSVDAGKTWTPIKGDLPANGPVLAIAEDHVNPNLLFVGTEFGLFTTLDGGKKWLRLKSGLPTIAVRDLAIQRQENDLVVGTFGRGIYVLDDYTPLRQLNPTVLKSACTLFPARPALMYIVSRQFGLRGKAFLGESFYSAINPPFGTTFTYYLKEDIKSLKEKRHDAEKEAAKKKVTPPYPKAEQLRAEAEEEAPSILISISDATGHVVRNLTGPVKAGFQRVSWNLREPAASLPRPRPREQDDDLFYEEPAGPLVMPGAYKVTITKRVQGVTSPLAGPMEFTVAMDGVTAMKPEERKALFDFQDQVLRLERAVSGALEAANALTGRLEQIKRALDHTATTEPKWKDTVRQLEKRNHDILRALRGDVALRARNENTPVSIVERVGTIVNEERLSLSPPTQTHREGYRIASTEFAAELAKLRTLIDVDLKELEKALTAAGAPYTPGRLPDWKDNTEDLNNQFLAAAKRGDLVKLQALINEGAEVNAKSPYGGTPLAFACDKGHTDVVKFLLKNNANPNSRDSFYSATPLTWAVSKGHTDIVRALLDAGATGADASLLSAVRTEHTAVVQALIDKGKLKPENLNSALTMTPSHRAANAALLKKAGAKFAKPTIALDEATLKSYAGAYEGEGVELSLVPREGMLLLQFGDQVLFALSPKDKTTFKIVGNDAMTVVIQKAGDKVKGFALKTALSSQNFNRAESKAEAPKLAKIEEGPVKVTAPRNWPSFRGPGASGNGDGQFPPTTWDAEKGVNLLWKTPIPGLGHSCPIVWGDRVFLTTAVSGDSQSKFRPGQYGDVESVNDSTIHSWHVYAIDKHTGKILWDQTAYQGVPKVKRHTKSSHANPTPATDGKHLIACFGSEGLYCYDVDGKRLWKRDLGVLDSGWFYDADYQWGFASSPIIYHDLVIIQCDIGKNSFIAAYNVDTGAQVWLTRREEIPSWGTPTIYEGKKRSEIVTNASKFIRGYDPLTGKELWKLGRNSEVTVGTPVCSQDLIFVTGGYPPIRPIYAIRPDATGDISLPKGKTSSAFVAWSDQKSGTYMPTPIVYGNYLYTCGNQGPLTCWDQKTGKQVYQKRPPGLGGFTASPVAADGKLYLTSEEGGVLVIKAGPKYELLATNPVGDTCIATPAIADGMFFIRSHHYLFALARRQMSAR